jgi:hypothetical protein
MSVLAIVWLALPVLAHLSTAAALAIAWPRASFGASRRRVAAIAAVGLAELVPWAIALGGPSSLFHVHSARAAFLVAVGTVLAGAALLATLALARTLEPRARRRALGWLVPHALFLASYLTDVGRDGIGQML